MDQTVLEDAAAQEGRPVPLDPGGQAETCQMLLVASGPASQLRIVEGSAEHGVEIVENYPDTIPDILTWLGPLL